MNNKPIIIASRFPYSNENLPYKLSLLFENIVRVEGNTHRRLHSRYLFQEVTCETDLIIIEDVNNLNNIMHLIAYDYIDVCVKKTGSFKLKRPKIIITTHKNPYDTGFSVIHRCDIIECERKDNGLYYFHKNTNK